MARKSPPRKKAEVVDKALRGMFKKLEARPMPDHIATIDDQLDEPEIEPLKKRG